MNSAYSDDKLNPIYNSQEGVSQLTPKLPQGVFFHAYFRDGRSMTPERMVVCTELIKRHYLKRELPNENNNNLLRKIACNQ